MGAAVSHEELSSALCDDGGGREDADGGDFCILTTDACCRTEETNATLESNYTPM